MRSRKVLYVCPNSKRSGAEQLTSLLIRHHDRARWTPQIYFFDDGPLVESLRAEGNVCHLSPVRPRLRQPLSVIRTVRNLHQLIRREGFDLIHSVMGYGHLFGGAAARLARTPEVWYQHGPTGDLDWAGGRVPTDLILTNSKFTAQAQARFHASSRLGVQVIYPGVESLSSAAWSPEASRHRLGSGVHFGIFGRVTPSKGHDRVLDAFAKLHAIAPDSRLIIGGDAFMPSDRAYLESLRDRARKLNLDPAIHWTGHLDPPYAAMLACDVIVNASLHPEPFGLTLIEGMSLGRAVLAPAAGGPLEIIRDDGEGYLFGSGNPDELFEKMKRLLDGETRKRLAAQAQKTATERFGIPRMMREIENAYDQVLE